MANFVLRRTGTLFGSGDDIWLRQNPAGDIARTEFFGAATGGTAGYIKYWTGTAWDLKPVKYWTGSAWVQKPVKYWDGSTWTLA
jgi:hypothetical protein